MSASGLPRGVRRIGRILSIGFPLPGPRVDNYNIISAPSFFDYDALVIDPRPTATLIDALIAGDAEATTFAGRNVRAAPPFGVADALPDILLRRRDEARALVDHGGAIICFAHPPREREVAGIGPLRDDWWCDDPPPLVPADGSESVVVDATHPLAPFVIGQAANIAYTARIDTERVAGARVFARSRGGAAIAAEVPRPRGRLVLLPALAGIPSGEPRYAMADRLQACIRRLLGVIAEGREPDWAAATALHGLDERARALDAAQQAHDGAQAALESAQDAYDALAKYRLLLWQEGALGLEPVVRDALRLIGFDVYDSDPAAVTARRDDTLFFIEVDASADAVGVPGHYRLRERFERAIERSGEPPRGILLINGHRLTEPQARPPQASPQLRAAADTMSYAVTTTAALFGAVAAHLRGDDAAVSAYRDRLVTETGVLD